MPPKYPEVPTCDVCWDPLVDPEDIEEGIHFMCGDFEDEEEQEVDERDEMDEGGESGC